MAYDSQNRYTGEQNYVEFRGIEISQDIRNFAPNESTDSVESTAGDDTAKSYIPRLRNMTFSGQIVERGVAAGTAVREAVKNGAQGTLTWGPEGTATGQPKYSILAFVNQNNKSVPYDGLVMNDITWQADGDWIENYDRSGDTW